MNKRTVAIFPLLALLVTLVVPIGDRLVRGQRGTMVGTVVIEVVDDAGIPLGGACFTVGYKGEDPAPTYCDNGEFDDDLRDGVIAVQRQPTEAVIREATPPVGYTQQTYRLEDVVTVPLQDTVLLTIVYVRTDAPGGTVVPASIDGLAGVEEDDVLQAEVIRLKEEVARLESRVLALQESALPPPNPRVVLGPGAYDLNAGPPFRMVCNFGDAIALNQAVLECARLP